MGSIISAFSAGGVWMWPILFAQIASIAIVAERIVVLYFRRSEDQSSVVNAFEDDIKKGNLTKVLKKSESLSSSSPLRKVVVAGTQAAINLGGREEVQSKMDEVLYSEQGRLEKRIEFLSMIGNVATLMGLLGTIVGMIRAFAALGTADQVSRATMLASGISEALHATAYGLLVAIPTLVAYSILQNRANSLTDDLTKAALRIYNLIGFHYETVGNKKTSLVK